MVEPLFPGSETEVEMSFRWGETVVSLRVVPASPLASVLGRVATAFGESAETELLLVYRYGAGGAKSLVIRSEEEFQAAAIAWPGSGALVFEVELAALVNMDFNALCLHRMSLLDRPDMLRDLDGKIMDMFEAQGVSFIMTMGDIGDVVYEFSIYHALALIMKMRQLTHPIIRGVGGNIVKFEGEKTFVVFGDVRTALAAALLVMASLDEYNAGVEEGMQIQVSIGIDAGPILLIPHDLYGDCVNTSSKLGEDTADPGDLLVSDRAASVVEGDPLFADADFVADKVKKSGVDLHFFRVSGTIPGSGKDELYARAAGGEVIAPRAPSAGGHDDGSGASSSGAHTEYHECTFSKLCRQRLLQDRAGNTEFIDERIRERYEQKKVILVSDMSGFTRTVRKFGILHFLSLIMYMRSTVVPILEDHGGVLVKTEADNLYMLFDDPDEAVTGCIKAQQALAEYNDRQTREEDKALVGIGLDFGPVLYAEDDEDIYGYHRNRAEMLGEEEGDAELLLVSDLVRGALTRTYRFSQPQQAEEAFDGDEPITYYYVKYQRPNGMLSGLPK